MNLKRALSRPTTCAKGKKDEKQCARVNTLLDMSRKQKSFPINIMFYLNSLINDSLNIQQRLISEWHHGTLSDVKGI